MKPTSIVAAGFRDPAHRSRASSAVSCVFIAMLVMLALALAGIALMRSTDTATTVNGNLVLKQAATSAVDRGIEQTIQALWEASPPLDRTQHDAAQNYYACVRGAAGGCLAANSVVPKIPDLLNDRERVRRAPVSPPGSSPTTTPATRAASSSSGCASTPGAAVGEQLQPLHCARSEPIPGPIITRDWFGRATRSTASPSASKARATP